MEWTLGGVRTQRVQSEKPSGENGQE